MHLRLPCSLTDETILGFDVMDADVRGKDAFLGQVRVNESRISMIGRWLLVLGGDIDLVGGVLTITRMCYS